MWVESVRIKGFRNLTGEDGEFKLELSSGINILCGPNAQGKTNIVEAVYFCATAHSHRTGQAREMIGFGQDFAGIQAVIARGAGREYRNKVHLVIKNTGRNMVSKQAAVNGVAIGKLTDLLGVLYCVIFSPEDLKLIKSGPSERRRFIDMELCQVNRVYYFELNQYYKILKQRNSLLKSLQKKSEGQLFETLDMWDAQLAERGERITIMRRAYIEGISLLAAKIHAGLCGEELRALYKPSAESGELHERLIKNRRRDIHTGITSAGIHKDDVTFLIDGLDSRLYGSQGQQRTAALSLKLAEVELIRREKGENPVLLLDDVMSELDKNRQEQLLACITGIQTLITCTTAENLSTVKDAAKFTVSGGWVNTEK